MKIEPEIRVLPEERYVDVAAAALAEEISAAIEHRGACRVALAGGSTPRPIYERLVAYDGIDWSRVTVLFGDERAVGPDDASSNYRMARQALGACLDRAEVLRIEGERPAPDARQDYERKLGTEPIDVLLLGMGDDGHTASLFPGDSTLDAHARVVIGTSPIPPTVRISLSLRALNEAAVVLMLVRGGGKATRLAEVHAQLASDAPELPAARVRPTSGRLVWLVDSPAAANLPHKDQQ